MSERQLQQAVVKYIRLKLKGAKIIANPFSEFQLPGNEAYRNKVLSNMKASGWEKSQPDLIIHWEGLHIALELKTEKEYPFRPFRGGGMWIDKTKDETKKAHVMAQAKYLHDLSEKSGFDLAVFVGGWDMAKAVIDSFADRLMNAKGYDYSMWQFDSGKYVPERAAIFYLKKYS